MKYRYFSFFMIFFAGCFIFPANCLAQFGTLDLSFDFDGIVVNQNIPANSSATATSIQSDGKIIVVGTSSGSYPPYDSFIVTRYNINGSIDSSFSFDGIVSTNIDSLADVSQAVAIQTDGKIVVGGSSEYSAFSTRITLVRYENNGLLDSTFDNDGIVIATFGTSGESEAKSISLQNDGKIIVAGYSKNSSGAFQNLTVLRFNTDGKLDSTFNSDGIVQTNVFSVGNSVANCIAIQNDGKIVVAGTASNNIGSGSGIVVVRYTSDGSLDSSFNFDGIVNLPFGTINVDVNSICIQPDMKIVVGGNYYSSSSNKALVIRYNSNGNLDSTFGYQGNGTASVDMGTNSYGFLASLQSNGSIIMTGYANPSASPNGIGIIRFNSNGYLDSTVGNNGIIVASTLTTEVNSMSLQNDGKIIVAGHGSNGAIFGHSLHVARINVNNPLSNEHFSQEDLFTMSPNPFSNYLDVNTTFSMNNATIFVYNLNGQLVKITRGVFGHHLKLDSVSLPNGLYHIEILENNIGIWGKKLLMKCN